MIPGSLHADPSPAGDHTGGRTGDGTVSLAGARPASRAGRAGWRDPRLWVGLALVAGSVLLGARLLAAADETVAVWALARDLPAGTEVTSADLTAQRLHFEEDADLARYLLASDDLPADRVLRHDLAAGELLPRSALSAPEVSGLLAVPIAVPALAVPPAVEAGSRVDVWITGERPDGTPVATPVLTDVQVLAAPAAADGFGITTERQLILAVDDDQHRQLGRVLAAAGSGAVTIVGRG